MFSKMLWGLAVGSLIALVWISYRRGAFDRSSEKMRTGMDRMREGLIEARNRASEGLYKVRNRATEGLHKIRNRASEGYEMLRHSVRKTAAEAENRVEFGAEI